MKQVLIFGTSTFAEIVYYYLTHDSSFTVAGFVSNSSHIQKNQMFDLPVVPFENIEKTFPPDNFSMFVAVGYLKVNKVRADICGQAKKKGYELISYVNSKATTWDDLDIGENCFIFENNVIQPFTKIGNDVIMWSGNHIGHHTTVGDHCFITSHVVVSGNVSVGSYCFLGVNSTIRDSIKIGSKCVIGAGSVILDNTKDNSVYTTMRAKLLDKSSDELEHF